MTVNFLDKETNDRLIAAIIAATDNKVTTKEISRMYGDSVKFNAMEWYLRKIRHKAIEMKAEADGLAPPAPKPAKKGTGRKKNSDGVKTGRVTKKKALSAKVKSEALVEDDMLLDPVSSNDNDFGSGDDAAEEYV
ncbi:uncharacterized protein K460DRAFT_328735 [Cucurbitaria berberidis CBS 394.84]|uniref:Uncharacterized protein n=1 Tax=Cucurbitaria berberidis CBS 394.84 TaxID=1168544 RepID=A0A9P4GTQ0_9PLEO|nr:uncharacterized protein K460DRAFT_328735 [Cucurbitaria berberidis CBS 394.84]KAF1851109.1 hypothetical protein K460DRAFT_328735 [Cucurbitaria berberidis CBS 394.84]